MKDFVRLIKAWLNGTYKVFPWRTLFVLIFVALYAIDPIDLIPDFIPIIGVIDDAAMLGFLYRSLKKDVEKFLEWERAQVQSQPKRDVVDVEFEEVKDDKKELKGLLKR